MDTSCGAVSRQTIRRTPTARAQYGAYATKSQYRNFGHAAVSPGRASGTTTSGGCNLANNVKEYRFVKT
jgi:hypothetical protein